MKAYFQKRILKFKSPVGTSRGILHHKPSWFLYLYDEDEPQMKGIGECSIIPGLSIDDENKIEDVLTNICLKINNREFDFTIPLYNYPAVNFAVETSLLDYKTGGLRKLFPSKFIEGEEGISINGLIWMGDLESMRNQVEKKIEEGFRCIKLKVGAIETEKELELISDIRSRFNTKELEIRVDANGAYSYEDAMLILKKLSKFDIHSIEQPIMPSQIQNMAKLCQESPVPIALDEELFGIHPFSNKRKLIDLIRPQYLVLKPSMLGGIKETTDWIIIANEFGIDWWVTSALESNIGLNAIAQWVYSMENSVTHGLGTGNLYEENVISPLVLKGDKLFYDSEKNWDYEFVF